MKNELPDGHGLTAELLQSHLIRRQNDRPSLTDVQHASLAAGVAKGASLLVVAPTSSGKTEVGLFGLTSWFLSPKVPRPKSVYLVSHRALARQKFNELVLFLPELLDIEKSDIVLATGDGVIAGDESVAIEPLDAPVIVATYEKFLGLLSGAGIQEDLSHYCFVCDEVQLVNDLERGQSVETLLTLLRRSKYGQMIALSAVLDDGDASLISNWLGTSLVSVLLREVPLTYELRAVDATFQVSTLDPATISRSEPISAQTTINILRELVRDPDTTLPIVVFCMRRADVFSLSRAWAKESNLDISKFQPLQPDLFENTQSAQDLAIYLPKRFAFHTADLIDEERLTVEKHLDNDDLAIVFATSTLASGLNYSFQTVVFDRWWRWNFARKTHEPIPASEFHNMAGRAGRLGKSKGAGKAIFVVSESWQKAPARNYLDLRRLELLQPRIRPDRFDQFLLQLIASEIVSSPQTALSFLLDTLSAQHYARRGDGIEADWKSAVQTTVGRLEKWNFIRNAPDSTRQNVSTDQGEPEIVLRATEIGRAVAGTGLLPGTAFWFLEYLARNWPSLSDLLPKPHAANSQERDAKPFDLNDFAFVIFAACMCSPEYEELLGGPTRRLPYQFDRNRGSDRADRLGHLLTFRPWIANIFAVNGADSAVDWISGTPISDLENRFDDLRSGSLLALFRDLAQTLHGLSNVLFSATSPQLLPEQYSPALREQADLASSLRRIIPILRRLAHRLSVGLPDDLVWMASVNESDNAFSRRVLSQGQIMDLKAGGFTNADEILDRGRFNGLIDIFRTRAGDPKVFAQKVQNCVRAWRLNQTKRLEELHFARVDDDCRPLVREYYAARGTTFENKLAAAFDCLKIKISDRDGNPNKGKRASFPDFILGFFADADLVLECKSAQGEGAVGFGTAIEVIAEASAHGYGKLFKVTVCQPYMDTDIPRKLDNCPELSVVLAEDLAEALVRMHLGRLRKESFFNWITQPGQAKREFLPPR